RTDLRCLDDTDPLPTDDVVAVLAANQFDLVRQVGDVDRHVVVVVAHGLGPRRCPVQPPMRMRPTPAAARRITTTLSSCRPCATRPTRRRGAIGTAGGPRRATGPPRCAR